MLAVALAGMKLVAAAVMMSGDLLKLHLPSNPLVRCCGQVVHVLPICHLHLKCSEVPHHQLLQVG